MAAAVADKVDRVLAGTTRRGTMFRAVRECYFRESLPCGSSLCTKGCEQSARLLLVSDATHYVMPDIDSLHDYSQVWNLPQTTGLIVVLTALYWFEEHERSRLARRLRALARDARRKSVIFYNENMRSTFVERAEGESQHDRNVRAIMVAAGWYADHLDQRMPIVVYLAEFYPKAAELIDLCASITSASTASYPRESTGFAKYYDAATLDAGLKSNQFYKGKLSVSQRSRDVATVTCDSFVVLIRGQADRNRALHDDTVVVEIYDNKSDTEAQKLDSDVSLDTSDDAVLLASSPPLAGRVVGVMARREDTNHVCTFSLESQAAQTVNVLAVPIDIRIPPIRVHVSNPAEYYDKRVVVTIREWPETSQLPVGFITASLGGIGSIDVEQRALLVKNNVSFADFSKEIKREMSLLENWTITEADLKERKDLRESHFVMSIDPKGSMDVDDALSVLPLKNGNTLLGVHIADVSAFVKDGSDTDAEAKDRSTSVYLSDRRINMLPVLLSEELCSLRGGVDRFAFSVLIEVRPDGTVVKAEFAPSIIRSAAQLYYEQAQAIIDGVPPPGDLDAAFIRIAREPLCRLRDTAHALADQRLKKGALVLAKSELRFNVAGEEVLGVVAKQSLDVHGVVAECMIAANVAVAEKVYRTFPTTSLLRFHPPPVPERFAAVKVILDKVGVKLDVTSNASVGQSLDEAALKHGDQTLDQLTRSIAVRAMQRAQYVCTADKSQEDVTHYGLGADFYTHFTSPIRRYADLTVHRMLRECLKDKPQGPSEEEVRDLARHMNERHHRSRMVQMESSNLTLALYIKSSSRGALHEVEGIVSGVLQNALSVFVPQYGLICYVPLQGPRALSPAAAKDGEQSRDAAKFYLAASMVPGCAGSYASFDPERVTCEPEEGKLVLRADGRPDVTFEILNRVVLGLTVEESRVRPISIRAVLVRHSDATHVPPTERPSAATTRKIIREHEDAMAKQLRMQREALGGLDDMYKSKANSLYNVLEGFRKLSIQPSILHSSTH